MQDKLINKGLLRSLIEEADLREIVETLGYKIKPSGEDKKSFCPSCKNHSALLKTKSKRHRFYCPACRATGDVIEYLRLHGDDFISATKKLCKLMNVEFDSICNQS